MWKHVGWVKPGVSHGISTRKREIGQTEIKESETDPCIVTSDHIYHVIWQFQHCCPTNAVSYGIILKKKHILDMAELRQDWSFPDVPEQAATVATVSPTLEQISAGFVILGALG